MLSPQTHLALIDAVIQKRLDGCAFESYSEQENRFAGTSLEALYRIRNQLQQEIAVTTGGCFREFSPAPGGLGLDCGLGWDV